MKGQIGKVSEIKNIVISIIIFILWSAIMFVSGYLLSDRNATKRINEANNELAEQQQRYDIAIREAEERIKLADERIQNIRNELSGKVQDNGQAITELSGIIEQIRKQKLNI